MLRLVGDAVRPWVPTVKISCSGDPITVPRQTLTGIFPNSYMATYFGDSKKAQFDGSYTIERDTLYFRMVLNFIRNRGDALTFTSAVNPEDKELFEMEMYHWGIPLNGISGPQPMPTVFNFHDHIPLDIQ